MDNQEYLSNILCIQKEIDVDTREECFVRTSKWDRIIRLKKGYKSRMLPLNIYVLNFKKELP